MSTHGDPVALERDVSAAKAWRRSGRRLAAAAGGLTGLAWAFGASYHAEYYSSTPAPEVTVIEADLGDVASVLTENGAIESAGDDVVRCRVESFLRLPAATPAGEYAPNIAPARRSAMPSLRASGATATFAPGPRVQAMARSASARDGRRTAGAGGSAAVGAASVAAGRASRAGAMPLPQSPAPLAPTDASGVFHRPLIRSFDHYVEPYTPLRTTFSDQGGVLTVPQQPPTIISIVPEGSQVKAGDVVCEIDSSVYRDALPVQKTRYVQAKAWLDQARYVLEANEIALREYEQGILPQDTELIRDYIRICEIEAEQARRNLAWSRSTALKGFRTSTQVEADAAVYEQATLALLDAQGMLAQLQSYTGRRVVTAHKAKIAAIRAELFALQSAFLLEQRRLGRIEETIADCTIRAPRDGIVVYANRVNGWGGVERQIREGLAVYKSQPIFRLLDPRRMQVKAVINETKVASLKSGQPVSIRLEAFPDRPLRGSIAEITPLPSLAKGPFSDVHSYSATVKIEAGGFDELREGLSAELKIELETHRRVTRVPLESIRWVGDQSFVALATTTAKRLGWLWQPVELGVSDTTFAEVVAGLEPGDRVVAQCDALPAPDPVDQADEPEDAVAMENPHVRR